MCARSSSAREIKKAKLNLTSGGEQWARHQCEMKRELIPDEEREMFSPFLWCRQVDCSQSENKAALSLHAESKQKTPGEAARIPIELFPQTETQKAQKLNTGTSGTSAGRRVDAEAKSL